MKQYRASQEYSSFLARPHSFLHPVYMKNWNEKLNEKKQQDKQKF
jgi:hypothetical protein